MPNEPLDPRGRHRAVYIISVAAELTGVHPQTLRVYERRGLVEPAPTGGMSRRYSEAQELTNDGLNLSGVRRVLELQLENERLRAELAALQQGTDLVPLRQEVVVYQTSDGRD